jgi:hypothetical protein
LYRVPRSRQNEGSGAAGWRGDGDRRRVAGRYAVEVRQGEARGAQRGQMRSLPNGGTPSMSQRSSGYDDLRSPPLIIFVMPCPTPICDLLSLCVALLANAEFLSLFCLETCMYMWHVALSVPCPQHSGATGNGQKKGVLPALSSQLSALSLRAREHHASTYTLKGKVSAWPPQNCAWQ